MAHDLLRTWAHHVEKFRECRVGKTAMDKNLSFAKRDGLPLERKTVNNEAAVLKIPSVQGLTKNLRGDVNKCTA